ncbi:MAG: chitosanase [Bacteroidetes bacterium]|nr:chitosanase [Bacteroidota bacterium]
MLQLTVKAKKLNRRKYIPAFFPDPNGIVGFVKEAVSFLGEEVTEVPNPDLGKWYKDRDNNYYWGGGLFVVDSVDEHAPELEIPDRTVLENATVITPAIKKKIEQVVNAFETGKAEGNYAALVKNADYSDPETKTRIVQVTFGRSQTTEFGNLKILIQDYVNSDGLFANDLKPYLDRIGKKPSLASDNFFCDTLIKAGENDPIMKTSQDELFDTLYYQRAMNWFNQNGFTLPLSLLVIYDSTIHSGGILSMLRNKFTTVVPSSGGDEKEWINNYANARNEWLLSRTDLKATAYRTKCLLLQIENNNWDLSQSIHANGVVIN